MPTLYQALRTGSKNTWRAKKRMLRGLGLKPGDWYDIQVDHLELKQLRSRMIVQNIHGRPAQYRIEKHKEEWVLVNLQTGAVKELDDATKYRLVIA